MTMKARVWIMLLAVVALLTAAAAHWPHFPGDVPVTRFVQSVTPTSTAWAQWISSTAKFPRVLVLLAVAVGLSRVIAGWRAALFTLASFAGMWLLGQYVGPLVARPRPSPQLVRVAEQLTGYSFPSVFALNYASTVGFLAVLYAVKASGTLRIVVLASCCVLLLVGSAARISLAAHWPSDLFLSYLIGLLWAVLLVRFV